MTTTFPELTTSELTMLANIIQNDFGDVPDHTIWSDSWDCGPFGAFCTPKQASGILGSLARKGMVRACKFNETVGLTKLGQEWAAHFTPES